MINFYSSGLLAFVSYLNPEYTTNITQNSGGASTHNTQTYYIDNTHHTSDYLKRTELLESNPEENETQHEAQATSEK